mmetsp:Transcript_27099/g.23983  ORF Transcript_27099/g.23983 Transcript_27099/m.23983 type:complete len:106 (+) Transcript_27099:28-345(+)
MQPKMDPKKMQEEAQKKAQMEEARKEILASILDSSAYDRLQRIRLVKPEKATQLENYLIKMAQSGQFQEQVSETYLVNLLEKISGTKPETTIKIVRKGNSLDDSF